MAGQGDIDARVEKLATTLHIDKIQDRLTEHDSSVLSVIPSQGFKNGVAGVFKRHNLYVTENAEAICESQIPMGGGVHKPGCYISIYVSRKRASGRYTDLAGFHASWFRGIDEAEFRPTSGFAEHLSKPDSYLIQGGFLEQMDRP